MEPIRWLVLDSRGLVIGQAIAKTKDDATRRWNRANKSAQAFALDAIEAEAVKGRSSNVPS